MSNMETIIRPFADVDVTPSRFIPPGTVGVPPVRVQVGLKGGTKTFSSSGSSSLSTRIGHKHTEAAPVSSALQSAL
jgi:hypothetical protein